MSFFEGLRYHFPAIMGIATTWILWPNSWEDKTRFRLAVFLSSLFSALFLIHGYASLFKDFNVFAFSIYLSFFEVLGILLFIATIQEWIKVLPHWKSILVLVILILLSLSVAFSFAKTESAFVEQIGSLLKLHALQIENGSISVAPWRIWEFFKGRLGWSFQTSRVIFSMVILMTIEAIILGGILVIKRQINLNGLPTTFTSTLVISFLCLSIIISPTKVLGGEMHNFNCQPGVISEHVSVAKKVSKHIQEYDTLFWIGVDTQVILLELMRYQDISIFPQQLNSQYSYRSGGDAEILSSYGFWNEELGKSWIEQSDVLFIEQQAVDEWYGRLQQELSLDKFDKVESIPHFGCIPGKKIDLYRRIP